MAALFSDVLGGICILGGAEAKDRPVASSISTGMIGQRDGLTSDIDALVDRVCNPLVQLSRDPEPHPSEDLEGYYLEVASAARTQCTLWTAVGGRQDQPSGACL